MRVALTELLGSEMDKQDYRRMLDEGFAETPNFGGSTSSTRLEYLSEHIFDFTTYESEMAEMFAAKALEVCAAISDERTFEYIGASSDNRMWYLLMCNMPFFADKLEWGTSIRGAWWGEPPHSRIKFDSCGLWLDGKQLYEPMEFTREQWEDFISAVREFAAGDREPNDKVSGVPPQD